jgi:hypothetical protein
MREAEYSLTQGDRRDARRPSEACMEGIGTNRTLNSMAKGPGRYFLASRWGSKPDHHRTGLGQA